MQPNKQLPYFQIGLLVVLSVIGIGIWRQKMGAPAEDNSAGQTASSPPVSNITTQPPKSSSTPPGNYDAALPFDSPMPPLDSLIPDLKSGNVGRIQQVIQHAGARRDGRYVFQLFALASEHGTEQVIQSMAGNPRSFPHFDANAADSALLMTSVQRILDRGDRTTSEMVLSLPFNVSGFSREQLFEEFTRQPWSRERFELVFRHRESEFRSCMSELIVKSLDLPDEPWQWFIAKLTEWKSRNQLYAYDFEKTLNSGGLVTAKSIDRLIQFLPFTQSGKQEFLVKNLPFLKSSHFDAVIASLSGEEFFPPPLLEYVLSQDPEKVNNLLDLNVAFRKQLKNLWTTSVASNEANAMDKLKPIAKRVLEFSQTDNSWVTFGDWSAGGADRCDWLWEQGFRPTDQTPCASRLYLAIHYQDLGLLRQAMRSDGTELQYCLNHGLEIKQKQAFSQGSKQFVPLLEIIRDWNLDAVTVVTSNDLYKWSEWKHPNPVAVAAGLQQSDVCQYLTKLGVPLNDDARLAIATMENGQQDLVDNLAGRDETEAGRLAPQLALQAAKAGDLEMLAKAISHIQFQTAPTLGAGKLTLEQRLQRGDFENRHWSSLPGIKETIIASIAHPRCFARLQFEGFPITRDTVEAIMESGASETLEIALSDFGTRVLCHGHAESILNRAAKQPQMVELYKELGMLNDLNAGEKSQVTELYQTITGKPLTP